MQNSLRAATPVVILLPIYPSIFQTNGLISFQRVQDEQELQELRAKIRVSELKRADDARRIRELETRLSEAETFVSLRPKLQAKLTQQQTDLIASKRELADAQQLSQRQEERLLDAQEQLELVSVDKEVAEERAEAAEAELDEIKERIANMEVELQVLREGGGVYLITFVNALPDDLLEGVEGGTETSVKQSLAYIQLEKQNERLKDALIRSVIMVLWDYRASDFCFLVSVKSLRKMIRSNVEGSQIWNKTSLTLTNSRVSFR